MHFCTLACVLGPVRENCGHEINVVLASYCCAVCGLHVQQLFSTLRDNQHTRCPSRDLIPVLSPLSSHGVGAERLGHMVYIPIVYIQGESPTNILNEDTHPVIRAIGVSHTACKDELRQNLRSHSWSVFYFYNVPDLVTLLQLELLNFGTIV